MTHSSRVAMVIRKLRNVAFFNKRTRMCDWVRFWNDCGVKWSIVLLSKTGMAPHTSMWYSPTGHGNTSVPLWENVADYFLFCLDISLLIICMGLPNGTKYCSKLGSCIPIFVLSTLIPRASLASSACSLQFSTRQNADFWCLCGHEGSSRDPCNQIRNINIVNTVIVASSIAGESCEEMSKYWQAGVSASTTQLSKSSVCVIICIKWWDWILYGGIALIWWRQILITICYTGGSCFRGTVNFWHDTVFFYYSYFFYTWVTQEVKLSDCISKVRQVRCPFIITLYMIKSAYSF